VKGKGAEQRGSRNGKERRIIKGCDWPRRRNERGVGRRKEKGEKEGQERGKRKRGKRKRGKGRRERE